MPSVNPGPSSSQSGQVVAVMTPVAPTPANPFPQGSAGLRCIALAKNLSLSGAGDLTIPVLNASSFAPVSVAFGNALVSGVSGSVAAATLSINSGPGVTGTSIRASAALTGQTTSTVWTTAAAATVNAIVSPSNQVLYVNITVAVANGTVDVYVYGYDTSPIVYP